MMNSPTLYTKNLLLRQITMNDAADMYEYSKLHNVGPSAGWKPHDSIEETKDVISGFLKNQESGSSILWAMVDLKSDKMIGTIELYRCENKYRCELGYSLNPIFWNRGLTTEACYAVLEFAFLELKFTKIEIGIYPDNYASIRVAEKLGFIREGVLRKHYMRYYDSKISDEVVYGMTIQDFLEIDRKKNLVKYEKY